MARIHYVVENGFLFHSVPNGQNGQKHQLLILFVIWQSFLQYAHDNPLSGHLGKLLETVYWPSIRADVWRYCKECMS